MNAFSSSRLTAALHRLDVVIGLLDSSVQRERTMLDYLNRTRGDIVATQQLDDMAEQLAEAKTAPALRVVK